jgi:hypothetical protein
MVLVKIAAECHVHPDRRAWVIRPNDLGGQGTQAVGPVTIDLGQGSGCGAFPVFDLCGVRETSPAIE